jgi:hypothetical protein
MVDKNWEDDRSSGEVLMTRSSKVCLTDREIGDFLFGRLSELNHEAVEQHLLFCHDCLDRLEFEEQFAAHLRVAGRRLENEQMDSALGLRRFTLWQRLAASLRGPVPVWAGAAVLCTLLLVLTYRWERPGLPQELALQLVRGGHSAASVPARPGAPLVLRVDLAELAPQSSYQLDLVDAQNKLLESAALVPTQGQLVWGPLPALPAGQYWVRLSGAPPNRQLLREFSLLVR